MTQISTSTVCSPARRLGFKAAIGILVVVTAITVLAIHLSASSGFLHARLGLAPEEPVSAAASSVPAEKPDAQPFRSWPANKTPDLVLVLSGQQYGYIQPCGCSHPQYGGLPRRYVFMQELKKRGWPAVVGVDLGDQLASAHHRGPQALLKYELSMKALKMMNYVAVGLGQHETEMPLITTLASYALNEPQTPRVLAANLENRQNNFANMVGGWVMAQTPHNAPRIGVVGIVGPTVQQKIPAQNPPITFAATKETLQATLKDMQPSKPEFNVMLYQGTLKEATACAAMFPEFNIVLCLSQESEPAQKPERVKDAWVVNVGQKGRYVGVVGIYRTGNPKQPFEMKYELVMLGEDYEKVPGPNPVLDLLENYTQDLKQGNYLAQYPRRKHALQVAYPKAEYVGSDACISCHREAYKVWQNHPHAHAYDTLTKATKPGNRQFDGECIVCHTVGFGFEKGYENEQKTGALKEVGCENCHGPGSLHANLGKKTPPAMLDLMNPYRHKPDEGAAQKAKRLGMIDMECQKCHDIDNDVHWDFGRKWPKVIHHTPRP